MLTKKLLQITGLIFAFVSLASCSQSQGNLEFTIGISQGALIPYKRQTCAARLSSTIDSVIFDIESKYVEFKEPRLMWKEPNTTLSVIGMTMKPDKNNCGMDEAVYVFPQSVISYMFARVEPTDQDLSDISPWNLDLYGTGTAEHATCKDTGLNGTVGTTKNDCNYVEGNDFCTLIGGGFVATKENCMITATVTIIGLQKDSSNNLTPVRATAKVKINNLF